MSITEAPADVGWGYHSSVVRTGGYLFLSNVLGALPDGRIVQGWEDLPAEGRALATGKRHLDLREGQLAAQTWMIFQRLAALLEENGSSIDGICKMQIYLTNKKMFPFFERVRMRLFDQAQPPSSCLGVVQVDPSGAAVVAIDVVAAVCEPQGRTVERVELPSRKQNLGIYAPGVRTDDHVFLAGVIPIDPETGDIVVDLNDLPDGGGGFRSGHFETDYWDGPIIAQTLDVHRQIERLLAVEGLGFEDVVRQVVYLRHLRDAPAFERINRLRLPDAAQATTIVQVSDVGSTADLLIEIDIVAARRTGDRNTGPRKNVLAAPQQLLTLAHHAPAVRNGPLVFVGGRVGVSSRDSSAIRELSQLPAPVQARIRPWGRVAPQLERAASQTAAILGDIESVLEVEGPGLACLRKLHVFLADFRDYVAVNEVVRSFFPEQPPAVSVIQVPSAGPGKDAVVTIDGVGVVGS